MVFKDLLAGLSSTGACFLPAGGTEPCNLSISFLTDFVFVDALFNLEESLNSFFVGVVGLLSIFGSTFLDFFLM